MQTHSSSRIEQHNLNFENRIATQTQCPHSTLAGAQKLWIFVFEAARGEITASTSGGPGRNPKAHPVPVAQLGDSPLNSNRCILLCGFNGKKTRDTY